MTELAVSGASAGADSAAAGVRALVVVAASNRDPDIAPFVGSARLGPCLLVRPTGGPSALGYASPMEREEAAASGLRLLDPDLLETARLERVGEPEPAVLAMALRRGLQACGVLPGRVAIAGSRHAGIVHQACVELEQEGWEFVAGHQLVRALRKTKSDAELAEVQRAADGVVVAQRRIAEMLEQALALDGELWLGGERLTVRRLKSAVAELFASRGLSEPEGGIVAPGGEGAVPHNSGTPERTIRMRETLVVDLFPRGRMFADCTRTFCLGEPPEAVARAHAAALSTLRWSLGAARPGVFGWSLQQGACERLGAAGYPTPISDPGTIRGYVHGLGHGVGYELHELPSFRRTDAEAVAGTFAVGDILTLEPGIYDPDAGFGVRLEDLVALEMGGLRQLTPLPYDLDPRAW